MKIFTLEIPQLNQKLRYLLGRVKNFIFKSLRVESMNYCFKSPPPKFQPQIRRIIALLLNNLK